MILPRLWCAAFGCRCESIACAPSGLTRNRYFAGGLLTAEAFEAEQAYHVEKQRLHNRVAHGAGVACGLKVTPGEDEIRVETGMAIDCQGREIIVDVPIELDLPRVGRAAYLCVRYEESAMQDTLVAGDLPDTESGGVMATRIRESFATEYLPEDPLYGHRRCCRGWVSCGGDHPMPIGRLRARGERWRLDRRYRRLRS